MATIYIDNQPYQVADGQNLLAAVLSLKLNLPFFCWHQEMGSVGACRQCAVKQFRDEKDTRGRIVMACMTPATDGTRISVDDPDVRAFRASVIEWLMENHPHDCPVCDEGSECHLQDMTVMTGHDYRRYRFKKRTYRNQDLGPFVNHEMNRCIQCYRCVRFYRDYAGGRDLNAFGAHNWVYFGREQDGVLESEFAGNLVEVCPTGVFTDKTLKRHYTRKWDLQTAPSICVHCSLGCNTIPGERYGELRRIRNRYNRQVNGYFLCDRGRYGYEFVNSDLRVRQATVGGSRAQRLAGTGVSPENPTSSSREVVSKEDALREVGGILARSAGVIGIGSSRASLEANFALRALVGADRFYMGISDHEARMLSTVVEIVRSTRVASIEEVRRSDAVLVLGEDVTNTAPVLALALRQSVRRRPSRIAEKLKIPTWHDAAVRNAAQSEKGPLFVASVAATRLDDVATQTFRAAPDDLARLGFAVAKAVRRQMEPQAGAQTDVAEAVARALIEAESPLIVSGTGCGEPTLEAAAEVADALRSLGRPAKLCLALPECNSMGLALMEAGRLEDAFDAVLQHRADTVIVLENDLYRRASRAKVDALLGGASHVIAIDHISTATTAKAEVVLPAATFAEGDGALVNNEGRAQRFFQVFVPGDDVQESWRWLRDIGIAAGRFKGGAWRNLDEVTAAMIEALPVFGPVAEIAPPASFRIAGEKVAREHQRYSGRTAMYADVDVSEPKPPEDPDSALTFSMEGYQGQPPPALIPRFWAPGWNSVQSVHRYQEEINGPLRGGDLGRRLIEAGAPEGRESPPEPPPPFRRREDALLVVPLHHIFGSEELSMLSRGVASLAPALYVTLNPMDAARLGSAEGQEIELSLGGEAHRLAVRVMASLPVGVAGVPAGLPEMAGIDLPAWSEFAHG